MSNRVEVTPNERHGLLTILEEVEPSKSGKRRVLCKCDCGKTKIVDLKHLRCEEIKSCGCMKKGNLKHGFGDYHNKLYKTWRGMRERCNSPYCRIYGRYGGRGIRVCPEWDNDFLAFREWALNNGYSDDLTIDRIDVNGNYEPSNCRWTTNKQQANNRRTNILITYNGETHTISEWSDITGIKYWNIIQRYRRGLPVEEIFFCGDLRLVR